MVRGDFPDHDALGAWAIALGTLALIAAIYLAFFQFDRWLAAGAPIA